MRLRLSSHLAVAGLLLLISAGVTGCVSMKPVTGGVLTTTYDQRFTDEAIVRDWEAMDALRMRIAAIRSQAPFIYVVTRAEAELNYSVEEYEENDQTGILDPLLIDAARLTASQEPGFRGELDLSLPELPGVTKMSQELLTMTEGAKANPLTLICAGEPIARLEAGLLMLAHEEYEVEVGLNTPEHTAPYELMVAQLAADLREALKSPACAPPAVEPPVIPPVVIVPPPAPHPRIPNFTLSAEVLFPFDTCGEGDILPKGKAELDAFGALLKESPDRWDALVVSGHTDRLGRYDYNLKLSMCRADTVRAYLTEHFQIPPERISARGWAHLKPVVYCTGPRNDKLKACLQPNRRVEIEVK